MSDPLFRPTASGYEVPLLWFPAAAPRAQLLFGPALGMAARYYRPWAEALAGHGIATALLEQRGHGHSSQRPAAGDDYGFAEWLREDIPAALDFLDEQDGELPTLVGGHSLGGHLGACYAALHPDRVGALVLVATAPPYPPLFAAKTAWQIRLLRLLIPLFNATVGHYPGHRLGFGGREARTLMRDWRRMATHHEYRATGLDADVEAAMARLDVPTLQLTMADDAYAPRRGADAVSDRFAGSVARVQLSADELGCAADHVRWARHPQRPAAAVAAWWDEVAGS